EACQRGKYACRVGPRWTNEEVDVATRARGAVEGESVGPHDEEIDFRVGEQDEQVAKVLMQPLKRHHRRVGAIPDGRGERVCCGDRIEATGVRRPSRRFPQGTTSSRSAGPVSSRPRDRLMVPRRAGTWRLATRPSPLASAPRLDWVPWAFSNCSAARSW